MVFNASRLLGKTVMVTGASSGIGAVSDLAWAFSSTKRLISSPNVQATAVLFAKVCSRRSLSVSWHAVLIFSLALSRQGRM